MAYTLEIAGDQSVLINFGDIISDEVNNKIRLFAELIESSEKKGIKEVILGYTNLTVNYDPLYFSFNELEEWVATLYEKSKTEEVPQSRLIEIPVLYGEEWGPDLKDVAELNHLTEEDVVSIHTAPTYSVYFLGFTPGFPFLGGMSEKIKTPRLDNPRTRIKAGSVGIANDQTGIYPVASPGGWRLIGHTPLPLYDPKKDWPFLLSPGDKLKFKSIDIKEYKSIIEELGERKI